MTFGVSVVRRCRGPGAMFRSVRFGFLGPSRPPRLQCMHIRADVWRRSSNRCGSADRGGRATLPATRQLFGSGFGGSICDRCSVRQSAPTLPGPAPHVVDVKLALRLEIWLRRKAPRDVQDVRGPHTTHDDPVVDSHRRNHHDIPANVFGNEPRKHPAFPKSATTPPSAKRSPHSSITAPCCAASAQR